LPFAVGDRGDQVGGAGAEPSGQHLPGGLPPGGRDTGGVVFARVVQQRGAGYVLPWVFDPRLYV
jgi:hypothetical protein